MMAVSSPSGPAGFALVPHRPPMSAWVGCCPAPIALILGGRAFVSSDFHDFRAHGPRMRIDNISASPGRFIACVSAADATVDRRPDRGESLPAADTVFALFLATPSEGGMDSAEASAAATAVSQRGPPPTCPDGALLRPTATLPSLWELPL